MLVSYSLALIPGHRYNSSLAAIKYFETQVCFINHIQFTAYFIPCGMIKFNSSDEIRARAVRQ